MSTTDPPTLGPADPVGLPVPSKLPVRELVLITGISGSGKSVALLALEDAGFYCVDNLPPELLREYMHLAHPRYTHRVAIAVDVRAAGSLPVLVPLIDERRADWSRSLDRLGAYLDETDPAKVNAP